MRAYTASLLAACPTRPEASIKALDQRPPGECVQLVGREVLHRAACLAPLLQALPLALPAAVAVALFVRPFLAALEHALATLLRRPAAHLAAFIAEVGFMFSVVHAKPFSALHVRAASVQHLFASLVDARCAALCQYGGKSR